jgi:hypothetical protein
MTPLCHSLLGRCDSPPPPQGQRFLLPRAIHQFHLDLDPPPLLAHTVPSNGPGADGNVDDVLYWLRASGLGPLRAVYANTTSLLSSRLPHSLSTNASCEALLACGPNIANEGSPAAR